MPPDRQILLSRLHELGLTVDSYGSDIRPVDDKCSLLSRFNINLCLENSISYGYVTEKLFDSFLSGCLPIYNCASLHETINPRSIFDSRHIFNISCSDELSVPSVLPPLLDHNHFLALNLISRNLCQKFNYFFELLESWQINQCGFKLIYLGSCMYNLFSPLLCVHRPYAL